ncbi:DedA family protein [Streptomyces asiaticus]|uniref:DedA family protein n=1 Tax=Streptomyces asiaticus TaxID=114695 RepID=UPI003F66A0BB
MHLMTLALPQEPSDGIADWAADLVDAMGGPGAGLAIALENLFPPLPSEVILPLTGFAAGQGVISLASALFWTTLGSVVGALVLYGIGMLVGRRRMHAIWAKLPLVKTSDLDRTEQWFEKHGTKAVFIGRMVPIFRSLISIPAGVERMPLPVLGGVHTLLRIHRGQEPFSLRWRSAADLTSRPASISIRSISPLKTPPFVLKITFIVPDVGDDGVAEGFDLRPLRCLVLGRVAEDVTQ